MRCGSSDVISNIVQYANYTSNIIIEKFVHVVCYLQIDLLICVYTYTYIEQMVAHTLFLKMKNFR